ncbi:MAG TPA: pyridoxal-phosphate dependent enzyme [Polyangiaceae bacterium]|nr:pyridoxal-phosphate dependent enzyme [Polyangiaceae bacterium]
MPFALFESIPSIERKVARVALGELPTPVESLAEVARELGAPSSDVWVKRDDISAPAYGGNKVRTLELLFGQARALGAERVISTGAFGSNHALATAIHAPRVGLAPGALLFPQPVSCAAFVNLRALAASGATLYSLPHWSLLPFGMAWLRLSAERGRAPYIMMPGGATPLGALGYVSAALELGMQIAAGALPAPRRVIVGVGSTCTSAGLLLGFALAGHVRVGFTPSTIPRVTSVRVTPWPVTSRLRILSLAARAARLLSELSGGAVPYFERAALGARFEVDGRFLGSGYGEPSASGNEAEALWRRLGLPALDGTYSAKAAARVVASIRAAEPGPILFWSTKSSVSLPSHVAPGNPNQKKMPAPIPARIRAWLIRAERLLGNEPER